MKQIDKKNIQDIFTLSPMQEGMLFHYLKDNESDYYCEQLCLTITGEIDFNCFKQAWDFVVETNEMLRTVFRWEKVKNPVQMILREHRLEPKYYDFSNQRTEKKQELLEEIKTKDREEKFHLGNVPFRVTLCKMNKNKYEILISNHHILYDGWSNGIILKEFLQNYHDLCDQKIPIRPVKNKFKEYIKWLQKQDAVKQEEYWGEYLKDFDTASKIPVKHIKAKAKKREIKGTETYHLRLTGDIKDKLENFVKRYKITFAALLYASWGLLLQKYNNTNDVIFGTTVSGRSAKIKYIEDIVGLFINTVPLRIQIFPGEKISDLLYRINKMLQIREEYESTPLLRIKEYMHMYSALDTKEELFDSIVVMENYPLDSRLLKEKGKLSIDSHSMVDMTHYDLTIGIKIFEEIEILFTYNEDVFDNESIINMSGHFRKIIRDTVTHPDTKISDIEIITEEEKNKILYDFNNTGADYPGDKTIHQLFEEQVERTPDSIAVVGVIGQHLTYRAYMTYKELNKKSNQWAYELIEKGLKPNSIVGIMVGRSVEMIIGILGILKSGGAYLPIDPEYPENRIRFMLADSNANVLLTNLPEGHRFNCQLSIVNYQLSMSSQQAFLHHSSNQFINHHSGNLAYVIYTSGTTGWPKGVMVEHRNVVNLLTWFGKQYGLKNGIHVLQMNDYVFDPSVEQILGPLLHGSQVYLINRDQMLDKEYLRCFVEIFQINMINFVPKVLKELLIPREGRMKSLFTVISGADRLDDMIKEALLQEGYQLFNHYGPTETTVEALTSKCSAHKVNLGTPIANTRIYILDSQNHLQPVGVPGELYIGGDGVSRGYLNNPELTAEKYIEFNRSYRSNRSYISYRTGDLGRWLPDGTIEFLGRIDHQIKIRGFRVELGEIENCLLDHPFIKEAVVTTSNEGNEEKILCAYLVSEKILDTRELKEFLAHILPDYMIPSSFVQLDKIPLTSNGKVDKKALPSPDHFVGETYEAPRDEIEEKLADIWSEVLGVAQPSIGIDNIFFDLGGDSINAIQVVSRIYKELNILVSISQLFQSRTIRRLADYIRQMQKSTYLSIPLAEKKEYYPLSSAQKRIYILQQVEKGDMTYNMPSVMVLEGKLDKERLEETFRRLIERHESFNTSFFMVEGTPVQRIHDKVEFSIEYYDLASKRREHPKPIKAKEHEDIDPLRRSVHHSSNPFIEQICHFIRPFDLSNASLLRVGLVKLEQEKHMLMVDMHHIISDGTSIKVLINDFMALYGYANSGKPLSPLQLQYKDFSEWINNKKGKQAVKIQGQYWLNRFKGEIPVLELPYDFPRPMNRNFEGDRMAFEINKEETNALKKLAKEEEVTLFMVLIAIYNVLLSKLSLSEDIVVGTPVVGREQVELQDIIGMFVNTLALRNYPSGQKTFRVFLEEIKKSTLEAFQNHAYPFDDLVEEVAKAWKPSHNPLFDTVFTLQNIDIPEVEIPGLKLKTYEYIHPTSKFDLTWIGEEKDDILCFIVEYRTSLFKKEKIKRFVGYFKEIITIVLDNRDIQLDHIDISFGLSDSEKTIYEEASGDFGF
jgi:amino acid adenylation domain-containing protein